MASFYCACIHTIRCGDTVKHCCQHYLWGPRIRKVPSSVYNGEASQRVPHSWKHGARIAWLEVSFTAAAKHANVQPGMWAKTQHDVK
jgi:hypothetical protein